MTQKACSLAFSTKFLSNIVLTKDWRCSFKSISQWFSLNKMLSLYFISNWKISKQIKHFFIEKVKWDLKLFQISRQKSHSLIIGNAISFSMLIWILFDHHFTGDGCIVVTIQLIIQIERTLVSDTPPTEKIATQQYLHNVRVRSFFCYSCVCVCALEQSTGNMKFIPLFL